MVFFRPDTDLAGIDMNVPDCIGSIRTALGMLADSDINLISVFTKVKISYQSMDIEMVADIASWKGSIEDLRARLSDYLRCQNGVYTLKEIRRL